MKGLEDLFTKEHPQATLRFQGTQFVNYVMAASCVSTSYCFVSVFFP